MASPWVGFSIEIGGLLAGLALANSVTHFQIASRMKPVRDFFIMLFFVALGARLAVGNFSAILSPAAILSVFVLIGNPLIVMLIMAGLGYRSRTSFLSSLTVAQVSEFSLILAALGLRLGHLTDVEVSLITLVGIVTITISSYFILYGDHIYRFMKPALKILEFRKRKAEELEAVLPYANHTVLLGAHRMGSNILAALRATEEPLVVIDFDPEVVQALGKKDIPVLYGDSNDDEIRSLAGLPRARVVISTIPDLQDNLSLLAFLKKENPRAIKIMTSENEWEGRELYRLGVDYVILPHFIGGLQIAQAIQHDPNYSQLEALRTHDLAFIKRK
jgi:FlaA1/EpsC-like NDP-sugar epimerase